MSSGRNPFTDHSPHDLEEDALQIMQAISKIADNPAPALNISRHGFSQPSQVSESHQATHKNRAGGKVEQDNSMGSLKRENPLKVYSVARKRVKMHREIDDNDQDDSQMVDSLSNKRVNDLEGKKHCSQKLPQAKGVQDEVKQNRLTKSLREKINKKRIKIEQMESQLAKQDKKNRYEAQKEEEKRQIKRKTLIRFLTLQYQQRIYDCSLQTSPKTTPEDQNYARTKESINIKLEALKERIKKHRKGQESISYLEQYTDEHQDYAKEWKRKVEDQRKALIRQMERQNQSNIFFGNQQEYHPLPDFLQNQQGIEAFFGNSYLPLYSNTKPENRYGMPLEISALNLLTLKEQKICILPYPKCMQIEKRMKIANHFRQFYALSSKLNQERGIRLFVEEKFIRECQQFDVLVLSRRHEHSMGMISLKELIRHYDYLGEGIAKHTIRVLLRGHQQVRVKLALSPIFLPNNILFDDKNDIKIENWIPNQSLKFQEFSELLHHDKTYLYFPPEYQSCLTIEQLPNPGIWPIAVILFQMLFGKKPFQFSPHLMDYQEFYVMTDLQFPEKPVVSDLCKDFLQACFRKPQSRIEIEDALKHPYFNNSK